MSDNVLSVVQLAKSYAGKAAVDGISFDIRRGEIFGLLGPNGAGKTTTIHMIASVLKPDSGEIVMAGAPGHDDHAGGVTEAVRIGIAPQALAIYEELTGEENVAFFGRIQGLSGAELQRQVDWALELTGLADRKKDRAGGYSGGMKRRLNLACAVVQEPDLLLLDEPTVGVDPQSRNHLFDNIESLRDRGWTVLYTTHYMEEAQRLCDRIAIMDQGRILALDDVDRLIDRYGGSSEIVIELMTLPDRKDLCKRLGEVRRDWAEENLAVEGNLVRLKTDSPMDDIAAVSRLDLDVITFRLERPNLEVVFLNLTGRTLRD